MLKKHIDEILENCKQVVDSAQTVDQLLAFEEEMLKMVESTILTPDEDSTIRRFINLHVGLRYAELIDVIPGILEEAKIEFPNHPNQVRMVHNLRSAWVCGQALKIAEERWMLRSS